MELLPRDRENAAQGEGPRKAEPPALVLLGRLARPTRPPSLLCIFTERLAGISSRPGLGCWACVGSLGERERPGLGPDGSPISLPEKRQLP